MVNSKLCVFGLALTSLQLAARAQTGGDLFDVDTSVTFSNQDNDDFSARTDTAVVLSLLDVCYFSSSFTTVDADAGSVTGDSITSITTATLRAPLTTWVARTFFNISADADFTAPELNTDDGEIGLDFGLTASYTASTPYSIDEVDADGNVVQTMELISGLLSSVTGFGWSLDEDLSDTAGENVKVCTFVGEDAFAEDDDFSITVQLLKSSVSGALDGTDIIVTPNSIESFVTIENFPYMDETNVLRLNFIVAAGAFNLAAALDSMATYTDDTDGESSTYFSLRSDAEADGATISVDVTAELAGMDEFPDSTVQVALDAAFGSSFEIYVFSATFDSPGAQQIVFDPTLGVGAAPGADADTSSDAAPIAALGALPAALTSAAALAVVAAWRL